MFRGTIASHQRAPLRMVRYCCPFRGPHHLNRRDTSQPMEAPMHPFAVQNHLSMCPNRLLSFPVVPEQPQMTPSSRQWVHQVLYLGRYSTRKLELMSHSRGSRSPTRILSQVVVHPATRGLATGMRFRWQTSTSEAQPMQRLRTWIRLPRSKPMHRVAYPHLLEFSQSHTLASSKLLLSAREMEISCLVLPPLRGQVKRSCREPYHGRVPTTHQLSPRRIQTDTGLVATLLQISL
jgi:hypothetical protein